MPLPVRPHPSTAPGTQRSRVLYDVAAANAGSDPCLEFLPEERVFTIVPAPSEPPRHVAQRRPQDVGPFRQFLRLLHPRTVLLALHRGVLRTLLSLYRAIAGTLLALYRRVAGTLLTLCRGVVETLVALQRSVMGAILALRRVLVWTFLALYRDVVGTLVAVHRSVMGAILTLRRGAARICLALYYGMMGTLLAMRRYVVEALSALHRGVVGASVIARWTTSEVTRRTRSYRAAVIEGTTSIGTSGLSRFRRICRDVMTRERAIWRLCGVSTMLIRARLASDISTMERVMSMGGRRLAVVTRALHERCRISLRVLVRNAQKMATARQPPGMRIPLWALKISRARVPVLNPTLAAVTGGSVMGALLIWQLGMQPDLRRPPDQSARGPDVVVSETTAPGAATAGTVPVEQQGTKPSPVSAPMVVMSAAVTVMSTPAGARVTVDGIGWGETPVTIRHLPPGQKVVRVTKEGYASQQRIVNVADGPRSAAVRITLRAHK